MSAMTCEYAAGCPAPGRLAVVCPEAMLDDWHTIRYFCGPSHAALHLIALAERREGGVDPDLLAWACLTAAAVERREAHQIKA